MSFLRFALDLGKPIHPLYKPVSFQLTCCSGTGADISNTTIQLTLPGEPGQLIFLYTGVSEFF